MECPLDKVIVFGADTDASPYDSGSYASSTTYVTVIATELCARNLRENIFIVGAKMLGFYQKEVEFDCDKVIYRGEKTLEKTEVSLFDIATASMAGNSIALEETVTMSPPTSPPPFMAGVADVEVALLTGQAKVIDRLRAEAFRESEWH